MAVNSWFLIIIDIEVNVDVSVNILQLCPLTVPGGRAASW